MNILYLLIGVSLLAAMVFLALFLWAVKTGQYDDTTTPAIRILFDDDEDVEETKDDKEKNESKKDNSKKDSNPD